MKASCINVNNYKPLKATKNTCQIMSFLKTAIVAPKWKKKCSKTYVYWIGKKARKAREKGRKTEREKAFQMHPIHLSLPLSHVRHSLKVLFLLCLHIHRPPLGSAFKSIKKILKLPSCEKHSELQSSFLIRCNLTGVEWVRKTFLQLNHTCFVQKRIPFLF